jgi:hypothetical protein
MNNKIIIFVASFSILISMIFLSIIETRQANLNSKNTWMLYFENSKDNSLDFSIANHSKKSDFQYKILADKGVLRQENVQIANGQTKTFPITLQETAGKKITIQVSTSDTDTKEIYKIF